MNATGKGFIPGIEARYQPRPPAPVRRCFRCSRPFTSEDTRTVGVPIPSPSGTGVVFKQHHFRCTPEEEIGLY